MSKTILNILSGLFFLHAVQNIVGYIFVGDDAPLVFFLFEFIGGILSFVCAIYIANKAVLARWLIFLRCLTGIFSIGTWFTLNMILDDFTNIVGLLRLWPVLLFVFTSILILKNRNEQLTKETGLSKTIAITVIIGVILNWIWSTFTFISLKLNPPV